MFCCSVASQQKIRRCQISWESTYCNDEIIFPVLTHVLTSVYDITLFIVYWIFA